MKMHRYLVDWYATNSGGSSFVQHAKGQSYEITEDSTRHVAQGFAEEIDVELSAEDAALAAEKAAAKAAKANEAAAEAQALAEAAAQAQAITDQAAADQAAQETAAVATPPADPVAP